MGMTGDSFFDSVRAHRIVRPDGTPLAGVCAGLAQRWAVDPLLVRAAFVALAFLGGAGITLYAIGWLLLPDSNERIHAQEPFYGRVSSSFAIALIIALLPLSSVGIGPVSTGFFFGPLGFAAAVATVAVVVIAAGRSDTEAASSASSGGFAAQEPHHTTGRVTPPEPSSTPPDRSELYADVTDGFMGADPRPTASPRIVLVAVALLLILAAGTAFLLDHSALALADTNLVLAAFSAASILLGLTVLIFGMRGRRGGGLSALAIIVALAAFPVAAVVSLPEADHHILLGERTWTPTSAKEAEGGYSLIMGSLDLDVSELSRADIDVSARMGNVTIEVGADQKVAVLADYLLSDVSGLGRGSGTSGVSGDASYFFGGIDSADEADIVIHVDVIMSDLNIERRS